MTLEDRLHSFQIKYSENGQEYTLYIQVPILLRISNRKVSKMTTTSPYRPRVMGNETSGYNWQGTLSVTTQVSKTGSIREFLQVWYKTCTFCCKQTTLKFLGKWLCCGETQKSAPGCQCISWTPRPTKSEPAPPLPLTDPLTLPSVDGVAERLVVVAVYPFTAIEQGDLSLVKGEHYVVLDDSQDHWWKVESATAEVGFIPSNYVKKLDDLGLTNFDWYN